VQPWRRRPEKIPLTVWDDTALGSGERPDRQCPGFVAGTPAMAARDEVMKGWANAVRPRLPAAPLGNDAAVRSERAHRPLVRTEAIVFGCVLFGLLPILLLA
jgi:hypothetical protein